MREVAESSKAYYQDQFTCLPKLRDFDWRMDVKISSKDVMIFHKYVIISPKDVMIHFIYVRISFKKS